MEEFIARFKEKYEFASWFNDVQEKTATLTRKRPFSISMRSLPEYRRVSRQIIPLCDAGSYYTLVDDMAEAADDGRRYRVMTTSYHSLRDASEGMLTHMISAIPFVRMDKGWIPHSDLCFCDRRENPRVIIFMMGITVIVVRPLYREYKTDDLRGLSSVIAGQLLSVSG